MIKLVKNHGCRFTRDESIKQSPRTSLVQPPAMATDNCDVGQGPIDMLPEDVLLDVFDFFQRETQPALGDFKNTNAWLALAHVCRRWRNVVFVSAHRLDLQLVCTDKTPAKKKLKDWPAFPIFISQSAPEMAGVHNIIAALKHTDRVRGINLHRVPNLVWEKILEVMQQPFPALKYLHLSSSFNLVPFLPDSFLGGSAPHLQSLQLGGVDFSGLPNLLSSAVGLVTLSLCDIYLFHPLEHQSLHNPPPPPTRIIFPALTHFELKGVCDYLKDLLALADAPILDDLSINLRPHAIYETPQLPLISNPLNLKAPDNALIVLRYNTILVKFRSQTFTSDYKSLNLRITVDGSDLPLSTLALVCGLSLPPLPTVERLYVIFASYHGLYVQNTKWLDLLYPFISLEKLYLSEELAPASQGAIKVLPTMQDIFLEPQLQEAIPQPFTPRQLFSYHILREPDASDRPPMPEPMFGSIFFPEDPTPSP
jgi:F-box-like